MGQLHTAWDNCTKFAIFISILKSVHSLRFHLIGYNFNKDSKKDDYFTLYFDTKI